MAAEVNKELGIDTQIVVGNSGEFTVWLGDQKVAEKKWGRFPEPAEVVAALKAARSA